jgi:hypothetical protein
MKRFLPPGCVAVAVGHFLGAGVCVCGDVAKAATISQWTFETNPPADKNNASIGPAVAADIGNGTATGVHASGDTNWTTPLGNGSDNSYSASNWAVGDYWQFKLSTLGFTDIFVAFDQTASATGPRDFKAAYSTDGVNFTDFQTYAVLVNASPNPVWNGTTRAPVYGFNFDLSAIGAIENTGAVLFRLTAASAPSSTAGTNRVDNFTVSGTEIVITPGVPESGATIVLLGLSLVPMFWKKLKR